MGWTAAFIREIAMINRKHGSLHAKGPRLLAGFTARAAVAALLTAIFTFTGCGGDDDGGPTIVKYTGTAGGETYTLEITDDTSYVLTVGTKRSSGTAAKSGGTYTLTPTGGTAFTVTVSGNGITAMEGTITFDNGDTQAAPETVTPTGTGGGGGPTTVTYTVNQSGGVNGSTDSTGIAFTFSADVAGLTAEDITLTAGTGAATKGTLAGRGKKWTLGITTSTAGTVKVKITKAGIESGEKSVTVFKQGTSMDLDYDVSANGTANTTNSTTLTFTFTGSVDSLSLTAADITIGGSAVKAGGALTGTGITRTLAITVNAEGSATVSVSKSGIVSGQKTVAVHKASSTGGSDTSSIVGRWRHSSGEEIEFKSNGEVDSGGVTYTYTGTILTLTYQGHSYPGTATFSNNGNTLTISGLPASSGFNGTYTRVTTTTPPPVTSGEFPSSLVGKTFKSRGATLVFTTTAMTVSGFSFNDPFNGTHTLTRVSGNRYTLTTPNNISIELELTVNGTELTTQGRSGQGNGYFTNYSPWTLDSGGGD
jgi:hypothetical protein